ncbi:MAG TPA: HAMP domain-containing sensor histidine kinase [Gemmatimonadaceae bacterium]
MTFRTRLALWFGVIALAPLLVFGYGVRREMTSRLTDEAARRVAAITTSVNTELAQASSADRDRLHSLVAALVTDNRFRIALLDQNSPERRWLLDWARNTMQLGGLAVLQLQDSAGRILSSGQFRNDFDRDDAALPAAIAATPAGWLVIAVRTPNGPIRALVTTDSFSLGERRFTLVGGRGFDSTAVAQLSRDPQITTALVVGHQPAPPDVVAAITVPYFDDQAQPDISSARVLLLEDLGAARALQQSVNRWLLVTLGSTLFAAILVGMLLASRVSRPLADLAGKTAALDLDRLDQRFTTGRDDEIGTLERLLDAMTARLRAGAGRLRETERLAATGDLARQINHDIKNGLAPIRNVLRHLGQTAERDPDRLAAIYMERRGTLDSSVQYLDELARNYARLSPSLDKSSCDADAVLREVAKGVTAEGVRVVTTIPDRLPKVKGDAVVLRRILENLVSNAVDALGGTPGEVTLAAEAVGQDLDRRVRFTVADTGRGMTRSQLDRAFDDFYTTKPTGTGLGLSVVRRLLTDLGGSIRVETAPAEGSTFLIEIPAA